MRFRLPVVLLFASVGALVASSVGVSAGSVNPIVVDDSQIHASTTAVGGASPLNTTNTVQHWAGTAVDPHNGVTYGFNMVGVDPSTNSPAKIGVDIIPINLNVGGLSFNGSDRVAGILASPLFQNGDYTSTAAASNSSEGKGPGGPLSAGNTGVQLEDATMRAQFNKIGTNYHLMFDTPVVHPAITVDVPAEHGVLLESRRQVIYGDVNIQWWSTELQNLNNSLSYVEPTRLPLYVTSDVVNFIGKNPLNCCVIGFHGAGIVPGKTNGPGHGNGNQPVQTYAWASWMTAGFFNPANSWVLQDINAFTHEVSEWADDPFVNNFVEPWTVGFQPQYGCQSVLETGDPVVGIGFSQGVNTTDQGPAPNGQTYTDGTYHPEDEVFLPWFMRTHPNTISQVNQSGTDGRFTLMGDLNLFGFNTGAPSCV